MAKYFEKNCVRLSYLLLYYIYGTFNEKFSRTHTKDATGAAYISEGKLRSISGHFYVNITQKIKEQN